MGIAFLRMLGRGAWSIAGPKAGERCFGRKPEVQVAPVCLISPVVMRYVVGGYLQSCHETCYTSK